MFLLLTMTYMASYMTRVNFGAVISEIVVQTGMAKSMLFSVVTGSAVTYGVGQLISGYVGDRMPPKKLVLSGLLVASAMNVLMIFATGRIQMTVIWCVNGLAQAFMWPPMAKLMADMFSDNDYKKASTMVNWGASFGTIAIYLLAPAMILLSGWRSLFAVTAAAGGVMAVFWQRRCPETDGKLQADAAAQGSGKAQMETVAQGSGRAQMETALQESGKLQAETVPRESGKPQTGKTTREAEDVLQTEANRRTTDGRAGRTTKMQSAETRHTGLWTVAPLVALIMLGIVLQGALRDGVTTWMPSYISETYHLSSEISILTGVALPVFSIVSMHLARKLYEKMPDNPIRCAAYIFGVGALSALLLTFVSGGSAAGSVLCSALLTGSMYGANLMLVTMVPPFFRRYGTISTVSGLLNSCTYVGSALSTYGFALLSDRAGWGRTVQVWFVIAFLGTVVCICCSRIWRRKM